MKNISKIFIALSLVWLVAACHEETIYGESTSTTPKEVGVFGDEMRLSLGVVAPDPVEVSTRAVDPDGKALQTLTVFCFDRNGLLISTASAKITPQKDSEDNTEGTISVSIPIATRIMHLVGNQNMTRFDKNTFFNKNEDEVLSILEGSAGMLIYWARVEVPGNVNNLYTEAEYELEDGSKSTAAAVRRTEPEAIIDWLTIETNPTTSTHRGINGKGYPIILLRNQAKFSIISTGWEDYSETNPVTGVTSKPMDQWKGTYFQVTGYALCNTPAFGTVAPYHTNYGFPTYEWSGLKPYYGISDGEKGNWLDETSSVTLPARNDKMTDVADVSNKPDQYIFETPNSDTDPINLILRGYNIVDGVRETQERYYYRVNIIDEDGEMIAIRRNHHYKIHILEHLTNGCTSFEEALKAPATNNIWASISDEVKAIRDKYIELSVAQTKIVIDADLLENDFYARMQSFEFKVKKMADDVTLNEEKLKVQWVEDDQQVSSTHDINLVIGDAVTFDTETGEGSINIQLLKLPEDKQMVKGTLLIKYGYLLRKISVIIVRKQKFEPAWVSSEVYGKLSGDDYQGENVTVIFTIPETTPKELFPMQVLVTTNGLDGRASSGQVLPIIKKGEEGYGDEFNLTVNEGTEYEKVLTDLGYKYEYTVNAPGQYRLYFHNIFEAGEGDVEYVVLQASHFEIIAKPVTFTEHQNKILLPKLKTYSAIEGVKESDKISYILVPQKRFAPVTFDLALTVSDGTGMGTISDKEEFLLYSTNLDHYPDDDSRLSENYWSVAKPSEFDCYFVPYSSSYWGTGGRVYGFYPRREKISSGTGFWSNENINGTDYNLFSIFLETNKPKSAEVVRIASNQKGSPTVKDASKEYNGMTFRSVTFELANYRPFRFAAQVNGEGKYVGDDATSGTQFPEVEDNIEFTYLPDEIVEVAFDVTTFTAQDGVRVSPFGTGFEIFIDAPMLTLEKGDNKDVAYGKDFEDIEVNMFDKHSDGTHYVAKKPKLEDLGNGRFVYRVDSDPNTEASYWDNFTNDESAKPKIEDQSAGMILWGDRKTIRFRKNSIVSSGKIVVSANPEHVTFHSKIFNINNKPIMGRIEYMKVDDDGNEVQTEPTTMPADQFVSVSRVYDDSRIGSLIVKAKNEFNLLENTYYELRLRGEYEFKWTNDPIKIQTQVDGKFYSITLPDLKYLYENTTIVLKKE